MLGCAALLVVLLTACGIPHPRHEQSDGSRAAFALLTAVDAGIVAGPAAQALAMGLVEMGICEELGRGRLYCSALDAEFGSRSWYFSRSYPELTLSELRLCIAGRRTAGFVTTFASDGDRTWDLPPGYARAHPRELGPVIAREEAVRIAGSSFYSFDGIVYSDKNGPDLGRAMRALGYGSAASGYRKSEFTESYLMSEYVPQADTRRRCARL